ARPGLAAPRGAGPRRPGGSGLHRLQRADRPRLLAEAVGAAARGRRGRVLPQRRHRGGRPAGEVAAHRPLRHAGLLHGRAHQLLPRLRLRPEPRRARRGFPGRGHAREARCIAGAAAAQGGRVVRGGAEAL
ncbi:MAG: hypothetical protein AVDCRST_MAG68-587, partial [uncultured Gemmatimonadetes bacterium]